MAFARWRCCHEAPALLTVLAPLRACGSALLVRPKHKSCSVTLPPHCRFPLRGSPWQRVPVGSRLTHPKPIRRPGAMSPNSVLCYLTRCVVTRLAERPASRRRSRCRVARHPTAASFTPATRALACFGNWAGSRIELISASARGQTGTPPTRQSQRPTARCHESIDQPCAPDLAGQRAAKFPVRPACELQLPKSDRCESRS
jgi:hypothetical protein